MSAGVQLTADGGDLRLSSQGLGIDQGLGTAVFLSLFCDARARRDDLPEDTAESRRGWWGDSEGDRFGSRLWLLRREKQIASTLLLFEQAATDALQWMVREQIVQRVDATASFPGSGVVLLKVTLTRGEARRWADRWAATQATTYDLSPFQLDLELI